MFLRVLIFSTFALSLCCTEPAKAETKMKFKCGSGANLSVDIPGQDLYVGRDMSEKRRGPDDCKELIENKDELCKQKLQQVLDDHEQEAKEVGKQVCEGILKARMTSASIQCLETSRNSCENPDDCSPDTSVSKPCDFPAVVGAFTRQARVLPFEVGGYADDQECTLLCAWKTRVASLKAELRLGCSPCVEGISVAVSEVNLQ